MTTINETNALFLKPGINFIRIENVRGNLERFKKAILYSNHFSAKEVCKTCQHISISAVEEMWPFLLPDICDLYQVMHVKSGKSLSITNKTELQKILLREREIYIQLKKNCDLKKSEFASFEEKFRKATNANDRKLFLTVQKKNFEQKIKLTAKRKSQLWGEMKQFERNRKQLNQADSTKGIFQNLRVKKAALEKTFHAWEKKLHLNSEKSFFSDQRKSELGIMSRIREEIQQLDDDLQQKIDVAFFESLAQNLNDAEKQVKAKLHELASIERRGKTLKKRIQKGNYIAAATDLQRLNEFRLQYKATIVQYNEAIIDFESAKSALADFQKEQKKAFQLNTALQKKENELSAAHARFDQIAAHIVTIEKELAELTDIIFDQNLFDKVCADFKKYERLSARFQKLEIQASKQAEIESEHEQKIAELNAMEIELEKISAELDSLTIDAAEFSSISNTYFTQKDSLNYALAKFAESERMIVGYEAELLDHCILSSQKFLAEKWQWFLDELKKYYKSFELDFPTQIATKNFSDLSPNSLALFSLILAVILKKAANENVDLLRFPTIFLDYETLKTNHISQPRQQAFLAHLKSLFPFVCLLSNDAVQCGQDSEIEFAKLEIQEF